ncbi:hypothetical protein H5410_040530 [Solanum commersonii]|uniref:Uncharacterized protein n=1 Tax=Solanum commersonii TaxID=4109 RepID=A0A9J5XS90_SOLCO|nr:hypothetical protein H5410_040530 [Solanum commersonii]
MAVISYPRITFPPKERDNLFRLKKKKKLIMPPRRAVRGRPATRNVQDQRVPNAPKCNPKGKSPMLSSRK